MRRGEYTVIVARPASGLVRRLHLSARLVGSVLVGVLVVAACFSFSVVHYYQMWKKTAEYQRLKAEVGDLRRENDSFRLIARQLTEKLAGMEVTAKKLGIMSGLDEDGLGGAGGPSLSPDSFLKLDSRSLYQHFRSLDQKRISLESELLKLQEYYNTRSILLASTPSIMPVRGYPTDRFGTRRDPFSGEKDFHPGIDISAPHGQKVLATADGVVSFSGYRYGYGKTVEIEHRFGLKTRYGHLGRTVVQRGQKVKKGDIIGYVGATGRATGPHLHYEVRLYDRPLNPLRFFREGD